MRLLPETVTDDAFAIFQERSDEEPRMMEEEENPKELIVGNAALKVVPVALDEVADVSPRVSNAETE